jgi:flavin-dependent dehydrogenase
MEDRSQKKIELIDGSSIAVIGGGPSGSFFSYFALEFASRFDLEIHIDIYEAKNFSKIGAGGCNHCGGIVSESLVQKLATDGIVIPSEIIQRGIGSYTLHAEQGTVIIKTPSNERRIASVFRGCGPKGCLDTSQRSFDNFLLGLCQERGARVIPERVTHAEKTENGIIVKSKELGDKKYDLVIGAVGLNKKTLDLFGSVIPGFKPPELTRTYISEFYLEQDAVEKYFNDSMHVFLLNIPNVTFGALIPKENYVTLVLLGKDIDKDVVANFISAEQVKGCFPKNLKLDDATPCKCYPFINVKGALQPYADRLVLIGDSASSKLYKNGIGAAYITGRAAANTVIFEGISQKNFQESYAPVCHDIDQDNKVGKFIFLITKIIQKSSILKTGLLHMVAWEQKKEDSKRLMSSALWDTFTGSAGYRNILLRFLNPGLLFNLIWNIIYANIRSIKYKYHGRKEARSPL